MAVGRTNELELHNMQKNRLSLWIILLGAFVAVIGSAGALYAQANADWTEPFPPFKIAGNLYYVGSKGLANYLIATPQGHILINSDLEKNVPLIRASVEKLGFKFTDIKILLISQTYNVVIIGSPNVNPGYRLVNNTAYPQIAADYEKMFRVLKSLSCDIFLGAHGSYFDLETKYARLKESALTAFVDPEGYKKYVAEKEEAFNTELAKQKAALPK